VQLQEQHVSLSAASVKAFAYQCTPFTGSIGPGCSCAIIALLVRRVMLLCHCKTQLLTLLLLLPLLLEQTKEAVAAAISAKEGEYIDKLLRIFDDCEDLDDTDSLR
jgi:hypothetical protein